MAGTRETASPAHGTNDTAKPHPLGVCKARGAITYRKGFVNQRCVLSRRGARCSGTGKRDDVAGTCCRRIGWNLLKPWSL